MHLKGDGMAALIQALAGSCSKLREERHGNNCVWAFCCFLALQQPPLPYATKNCCKHASY